MRIFNDSIENAVGIQSASRGMVVGVGYTGYAAPTNGMIVQGNIGIGTTQPGYTLHVQGTAKFGGAFYDSNNSVGSLNQVLASTGTGISWTTMVAGSGSIGGSIAAPQMAFASASNTLAGVSTFVYWNERLGIGTAYPTQILDVRGNVYTSSGFYGYGTNITNLNATQLLSGTVPSARMSGSYTGITSVGIQDQLRVTGITTVGPLYVTSRLHDVNNSSGTSGQILSSTGTGVDWIDAPSGSMGGSVVAPQIPFATASNTLSGVTTFVYWNERLGLGTAYPTQILDVRGNAYLSGLVTSHTLFISSSSYTQPAYIRFAGPYNDPITLRVGMGTTGSISFTGSEGELFSVSNNLSSGSIFSVNDISGMPSIDVDADGTILLMPNGIGSVGIGTDYPLQMLDVRGNFYSTGIVTSLSFHGAGAYLTNLNATQLTSGTVPDARLSGTYAGITSVGNLNRLLVVGITTSTAYYGIGANLTNLNATQLLSGTVPSARMSGSYTGITSVGIQDQLRVTGITTVGPLYVTNRLHDVNNQAGSAGQLLSSTGSGVDWIDPPSGSIGGAIAAPQVAFASASNTLAGVATFVYWNERLGVGTIYPKYTIDALGGSIRGGNLYLGGLLYDNMAQPGDPGQLLFSDAGVLAWLNPSAYGICTAEGTVNYVPKFAPTTGYLVNSKILETNGDIQIGTSLGVYADGPILYVNVQNNSAESNAVAQFAIVASGSTARGQLLISGGHTGAAYASRILMQEASATKYEIFYSSASNRLGIDTTSNFYQNPIFSIEDADRSVRIREHLILTGGYLGINTIPTQSLHVQNGARFNGAVYDINNVSGAAIGIVSQVLTSTGTGVTWAPVKRGLAATLITALTPTQIGIDTGVFIVPYDPKDGTTNMSFSNKAVRVRVETPSAGITTINLSKSVVTGAFAGANMLSSNILITGAGVYEASSTSFTGYGATAVSGDKIAVNFIGTDITHKNFTVVLAMNES